ncbi:MAG: hypothetical protein HC884_13650 [Chloroflexaceae bacterium]|nr:hypothetical protein [Chloroflexaceae bacterium]
MMPEPTFYSTLRTVPPELQDAVLQLRRAGDAMESYLHRLHAASTLVQEEGTAFREHLHDLYGFLQSIRQEWHHLHNFGQDLAELLEDFHRLLADYIKDPGAHDEQQRIVVEQSFARLEVLLRRSPDETTIRGIDEALRICEQLCHQAQAMDPLWRDIPAPDVPGGTLPSSDLADEPSVGMWKDREDMQDSVAWVRNLRRGASSG